MNRPLPDFILHNFRWKLVALTLAVFVWFLIQSAISKGVKPSEHPLADPHDYTFSEEPVHVLQAPDDARVFQVTPAKVQVVVRSTTSALNPPVKDDIRVFVDLSDATNLVKEMKEVFVQISENLDVLKIKVQPRLVTVEQLRPQN